MWCLMNVSRRVAGGRIADGRIASCRVAFFFPTATVGWTTRETWCQRMRADSVLDDGSYDIALSEDIKGGFID